MTMTVSSVPTIPTILIVEDDPAMQIGLRDNLELEGYRVLVAGTLRAGREAVRQDRPDILLLDLMLPDGDGLSLCRQLRADGFVQPILMLTARGEELDRLLGFEVGADDYIVKPFSLRELLARVRAHLRRRPSPAAAEGPAEVGEAVADFRRHQLSREGQLLEVSAKEMELLRYLVGHRGQVVSRDELLSEVWGYRAEITTRTVDNFIVRLRKKIEANPAEPVCLVTVHGKGYKLLEQ
ncbi:MAG: response regulator transcription factor [Pseudomonadota bacterium]